MTIKEIIDNLYNILDEETKSRNTVNDENRIIVMRDSIRSLRNKLEHEFEESIVDVQ